MSDFLPLTQFDFHHRLADTNGPALVLFTQPGCGACRHLRTVLAGCEWARDLRLFEVDAGRDLALTREFEVFHLPALHLFVDGRYHAPIHAEATPTRLHAALVQALASPPMEAP